MRGLGGAWLAALGAAAALSGAARADDDPPDAAVIFARGSSLYQVDARGRGETEIAELGGKVTVRALRTSADGSVLLADLAGKWAWMPLDGSTRTLTELPCADGPAQLSEDGASVLCRSPRSATQSLIVDLARARPEPRSVDVPPAGGRIVGVGPGRRLVWADAAGVWSASADLRSKARVAPDAPVRGFLPSPDGTRAIGVYSDQIYTAPHQSRLGEVLMTLQLDGQGARRKAIRDGVAVEWSHDSQWVLVQDGASACIMRAAGGQYKCWRGFTAASLSSDGRWALALGNRDGSRKQTPSKKKPAAAKTRPARPVRPPPAPRRAPEPGEKPWDNLDEPFDEPESAERLDDSESADPADDDVNVAPPSGPLSLFRLRLDGAFTDRPVLLVKVVDGAAAWAPRAP